MIERITATAEHPFFVDGKGWVGAGHRGIDAQIVARAGPRLVVKSVTPQRRAAGYAVYNFTVEGDHTYFVGAVDGGAWVHNACNPQQIASLVRRIRNTIACNAKLEPLGEVPGASSELLGITIPHKYIPNAFYDHVTELQNAMNGLAKNAALLEGSTDPIAQAARQEALDHLEKIWEALGQGLYP